MHVCSASWNIRTECWWYVYHVINNCRQEGILKQQTFIPQKKHPKTNILYLLISPFGLSPLRSHSSVIHIFKNPQYAAHIISLWNQTSAYKINIHENIERLKTECPTYVKVAGIRISSKASYKLVNCSQEKEMHKYRPTTKTILNRF